MEENIEELDNKLSEDQIELLENMFEEEETDAHLAERQGIWKEYSEKYSKDEDFIRSYDYRVTLNIMQAYVLMASISVTAVTRGILDSEEIEPEVVKGVVKGILEILRMREKDIINKNYINVELQTNQIQGTRKCVVDKGKMIDMLYQMNEEYGIYQPETYEES